MPRGENILVSEHPLPKYNGVYTTQSLRKEWKTMVQKQLRVHPVFLQCEFGGGPSWSLDDRSQDGTNDWFRGGWIEPPSSGGPPLGTRTWNNAGSHRRFEIKMESIPTPDENSRDATPLKTGWYRMELADGSLIERARVHRDERKTRATNEFTATGDLTGDVTWYVEGNEVKVPKFGSTGTIQANGNIAWHRTATKPFTKETPVNLQQEINPSAMMVQKCSQERPRQIPQRATRWSCRVESYRRKRLGIFRIG